MATKGSSKAVKSAKNRSKRIPSVKRLDSVRPLVVVGSAHCNSANCKTQ